MADVSFLFGGMYISSSSSTTLSATTPAKAAGTTTSMGLNGFSHSSNRLTYTQATTRTFHVTASLSASTASGAETCDFSIRKNGAVITGATIRREVANNDVGAVSVECLVSLAQNDYVEIWVESAGGDDITLDNGVIVARVAG